MGKHLVEHIFFVCRDRVDIAQFFQIYIVVAFVYCKIPVVCPIKYQRRNVVIRAFSVNYFAHLHGQHAPFPSVRTLYSRRIKINNRRQRFIASDRKHQQDRYRNKRATQHNGQDRFAVRIVCKRAARHAVFYAHAVKRFERARVHGKSASVVTHRNSICGQFVFAHPHAVFATCGLRRDGKRHCNGRRLYRTRPAVTYGIYIQNIRAVGVYGRYIVVFYRACQRIAATERFIGVAYYYSYKRKPAFVF